MGSLWGLTDILLSKEAKHLTRQVDSFCRYNLLPNRSERKWGVRGKPVIFVIYHPEMSEEGETGGFLSLVHVQSKPTGQLEP